MKFQKLLGAYIYVIMSTRLKPSLIVQGDSLKLSIKYNFLQDQEISRIWLNKFTLFEGVDRGGGGTGVEGAESGVEGAESGGGGGGKRG